MPLFQIDLKEVTKKYRNRIILNNVNLSLDNTKYNIIKGYNGSGKSTLIKCLMNFIKYEGKIKNKYKVSYVPEKTYLPAYIKVNEFLNMIAKIKNSSLNIDEYLEKFEILKYKDKELSKLSLGTKQKILIIQSLLEDADVYIFDEPLNGLDDFAVKVFNKELQRLRKKQKLIIIVMHDDYRLKLLNKRIILIDEGKVYG